MVTTILPPSTGLYTPILPKEIIEQPKPNQYTIVFTDVRRLEPPDWFTSNYLEEMYRRCPEMLYFRAVIGEKARTTAAGELMAIEDKLSIIEVTPYLSDKSGYIRMVKAVDSAVVTLDAESEAYIANLKSSLGRENFNLMLSRLRMDGVIAFNQTDGLYLTLFPVVPISNAYNDLAKNHAETEGRRWGYPYNGTIIPTLSQKPFPHTTLNPYELSRMAVLGRDELDRMILLVAFANPSLDRRTVVLDGVDETSQFALYDIVQDLFRRANGDTTQFLPFDKNLVPPQYRGWNVKLSHLEDHIAWADKQTKELTS